MKFKVHGSSTSIDLADQLFAARFNEPLVHQIVTAYMAAGRSGTKAQKRRSDVRGGGAKPWRQKGTGRARAGTSRSPLWTGGGVTFAARPRDFAQKVNRKMYRAALRSMLSELVRQDRIVVVEELSVGAPRTKELKTLLGPLGFERGLIIAEAFSENLWLAARNLPDIEVSEARGVDPLSLVRADKVLMTAAAVRVLEERLA